MTKKLSALLTIVLSCVWLTAVAKADEPAPHKLVDSVTHDLMKVVAEKGALLDEQPEVYFSAVGDLLEPVVDFEFIARAVMGPYARQATPAQREKFVEAFKSGLISTYSKGIVGFSDLEMTIVPPKDDINGKRRVSVLQEVRGGDKVNRVYYTMAMNRKGEWKLINLVLNGVNLGETLRNQFSSSMKRLGDIDTVIAQWGQEQEGGSAQEG